MFLVKLAEKTFAQAYFQSFMKPCFVLKTSDALKRSQYMVNMVNNA